MSDFCKQCSIDVFGEDFGDFAITLPPGAGPHDGYRFVLCEGCGPSCIVDPTGKCVSHGCLKQHGIFKELDEACDEEG